MLSQKGIDKLQALRVKLIGSELALSSTKGKTNAVVNEVSFDADDEALKVCLMAKQYPDANKEKSEYSEIMLVNAIAIIDDLLTHNDVKYWGKKENKGRMFALFSHIDANSETYIPAIFNEQSYDLAVLVREFMLSINVKEDFKINRALKALLGDPQEQVSIARENLEFNLRLYDIYRRDGVVDKDITEVNKQLAEFSVFEKKAEALTKGDSVAYQQLLKEYTDYAQSLCDKLDRIPYLRFAGVRYKLNAEGPSLINLDDTPPCGASASSIQFLLKGEKIFNQILQEKEIGILPVAHQHFLSKFDSGKVSARGGAFIQVVKDFIAGSESYIKGGHLRLSTFRSVNAGKVDLFQFCIGKMMGLRDRVLEPEPKTDLTNEKRHAGYRATFKSQSDGYEISDGLNAVFTARLSHSQVVKAEGISLGQGSRLLNHFAYEFLKLFDELSPVNDAHLHGFIQENMQELGMLKEGEASAVMSV